MNRRMIIAAVAAALWSASANAAPLLNAGSVAPPLKPAKWVTGTPVTSFAPGKVYAVFFFTTWSEPCQRALPQIAGYVKQFKGKVNWLAVSVWEKPAGADKANIAGVARFAKARAAMMPYPVAADGPSAAVTKSWLDAAGETGVPSVFVIGKTGKLAWIGDPVECGYVLPQVVSGAWDVKKWGDWRAKVVAEDQKERKLFAKMEALVKGGQHKAALAECDRIIREKPDYEQRLRFFRYNMLIKYDEPGAWAYCRHLLANQLKNESGQLWLLARAILENPELKHPDWDAAYALALRSAEITKYGDANIITALAFANFKKGNVAKALELQEKAMPIAAANREIPERVKQTMAERLEMYRKAGGK